MLEELKSIDWPAFEEAIFGLSPLPVVDVIAEHRRGSDNAIPIFKWLLDAVPNGTFLKRVRDVGKLQFRFALGDGENDWPVWTFTDSREIFSAKSEYTVGGQTITLSPPDLFGFIHCEGKNKEQYLENIRCRPNPGATVDSSGLRGR